MTKQRLLFLIGIWIAILPFLGFPRMIKDVFFLMTGLGVMLMSYFMYIQLKAISEMDTHGGPIFVDTNKDQESEVVAEVEEEQEVVANNTQEDEIL